MSDDGFIKIADLMESPSVKKCKPKFSDILDWVANNDKKRFQIRIEPKSDKISLENGYIRASQGHTMKGIEEEKLLTKITFPYKYPTIVHGTYSKVLAPIQEKGLCKMQRNHIHMAKGYAGDKDVISGMRGTCDLYIEVNLAKAIKDDIPIYISANDVILTGGKDGYLGPEYFRKIVNKKGNLIYSAKLDYIVVFDFEAICDKDGNDKFEVQEIIEFPAVVIDCKQKKIIKAFQTYVKPQKYPDLTEFWTELTGITQEQVDGGVPIEEAVLMFHKFLKDAGVLGSEFAMMSCGDYDAKALKREAEFKKFFVPSYMKEWINIKKVFPLHKYDSEVEEKKIDKIKKVRPVVKGMTDMLEKCSLDLLGRHHSGIDDSFNIARWVVKTLEDDFHYEQSHINSVNYETTDDKAIEFEQRLIEDKIEVPEIDCEAHLESMIK